MRSRYETKLDRYHVFIAVRDFISDHGYSPSYRELASLSGVRSIETVQRHLKGLQRDGHLAFNHSSARTIHLTGSEPKRPNAPNEDAA